MSKKLVKGLLGWVHAYLAVASIKPSWRVPFKSRKMHRPVPMIPQIADMFEEGASVDSIRGLKTPDGDQAHPYGVDVYTPHNPSRYGGNRFLLFGSPNAGYGLGMTKEHPGSSEFEHQLRAVTIQMLDTASFARQKAGVLIRGSRLSDRAYNDVELINQVLGELGLDDSQSEQISKSLEGTIRDYRQRSEEIVVTHHYDGTISQSVGVVGDLAFKVSDLTNYEKEWDVYSEDLGEFNQLRLPLAINERIANEDIGVIALKNLDTIDSVFSRTIEQRTKNAHDAKDYDLSVELTVRKDLKSPSPKKVTKNAQGETVSLFEYVQQEGAVDVYDFIDHHMYVMGLFHANKNVTSHTPPAGHVTRTGADYVDDILDIPNEFSALTKEHRSWLSQSKNLLASIGNEIVEQAYCVIDGDYGIHNTRKGVKYDFNRVRLGSEVEDLARFLDQVDFDLTREQKHHFVTKYAIHRVSHDPQFADREENAHNFYAKQGFWEALRVVRTKPCWDRPIRDPYYANMFEHALNLAKEYRAELMAKRA